MCGLVSSVIITAVLPIMIPPMRRHGQEGVLNSPGALHKATIPQQHPTLISTAMIQPARQRLLRVRAPMNASPALITPPAAPLREMHCEKEQLILLTRRRWILNRHAVRSPLSSSPTERIHTHALAAMEIAIVVKVVRPALRKGDLPYTMQNRLPLSISILTLWDSAPVCLLICR